jgi:hypothetical protein
VTKNEEVSASVVTTIFACWTVLAECSRKLLRFS